MVHSIKVSADTVRCITISPDEKQVAFGCRDNQVKIYDLEDYTLIKTCMAIPWLFFRCNTHLMATYLGFWRQGRAVENLGYGKTIPAYKIYPRICLRLIISCSTLPGPILPPPVWIKALKFGMPPILNCAKTSAEKKAMPAMPCPLTNWHGMVTSCFPLVTTKR
jgi:hypothetical protein